MNYHTILGQTADGTLNTSDLPPSSDNVRDIKAPFARCYRLPVFPAQCRSDVSPVPQTWFYDATSSTCRQLPFVGCGLMGDSENSFETLEECRATCEVKPTGTLMCDTFCRILKLTVYENNPNARSTCLITIVRQNTIYNPELSLKKYHHEC